METLRIHGCLGQMHIRKKRNLLWLSSRAMGACCWGLLFRSILPRAKFGPKIEKNPNL